MFHTLYIYIINMGSFIYTTHHTDYFSKLEVDALIAWNMACIPILAFGLQR